MIATFPSDLVQLDPKSYSELIKNNTVRSEFDTGPARQAPVESLLTKRRSVTYLTATKDDYLEFLRWYQFEINCGAKHFLWQDPVDNEWKRVRMVPDDLKPTPRDILLDVWSLSFVLEGLEG